MCSEFTVEPFLKEIWPMNTLKALSRRERWPVAQVGAEGTRPGYKNKKTCTPERCAGKRESKMAHTYFQLLYHLVWSTKDRKSLISDNQFEDRLHNYIGGSFKAKDCLPLQIGGMPDHLHALVTIPPTLQIAEVIRNIKVSSSKWAHQIYPEFSGFGWQEGYGAFSISASNREAVVNYIKNQKEHHKVRSFQDEFIALLDRYGINYDEKYLWK